jgi:hypothetical protein
MNNVIDVFPGSEAQVGLPRRDEIYRVFASNLKRSPGTGRLLGSVSFYVPSLQLHLWCRWERDDRGNERIVMPRLEIEAPDGKRHRKTLLRWGTAQAEERFQREALRALHQLIAATEGDRLSAQPQSRPLSRQTPTLPSSVSPNANRFIRKEISPCR